jgi:hypothetical protein
MVVDGIQLGDCDVLPVGVGRVARLLRHVEGEIE